MPKQHVSDTNAGSPWRLAWQCLALSLGYLAAAELGYSLSNPASFLASFWPASGVYLAVLARSTWRRWPAFIAAMAVASLTSDVVLHDASWGLGIAFCLANTAAACLGAILLQLTIRSPLALNSSKDVVWFVSVTSLCSSPLGATLGGLAIWLATDGRMTFMNAWLAWWSADAAGTLVTAAWLTFAFQGRRPQRDRSVGQWLESFGWTAAIVVVSGCAFGPYREYLPLPLKMPFLVVPTLLGCAMRRGRLGATGGAVLLFVIAGWGTSRGYGIFAISSFSVAARYASLQIYLTVSSITALLFAAVLDERKWALELLALGEAKFRRYIDSAASYIWLSNGDMRCEYCNASLLKFLGCSVEQLRESGWNHWVEPNDFDLVRDAMQAAYSARQMFQVEYRMRRHDGQYRWFSDIGRPVFSADEQFLGYIGCADDITDRRAGELALRESEQRFRVLADGVPVLIWIAGPDKQCTYLNRAWLDFTGRSLDQELGDGWTQGVHGDDLAECLNTYHSAFDTRGAIEMTYRLRRRDGEFRWMFDSGTPLFQSDGTFVGYIGGCIDITERRNAEQALQRGYDGLERRVAERTAELSDACRQLEMEMTERLRTERQLQQHLTHLAHVARVSTMGEMAAGLAHEINQPLYAITNFASGSLSMLNQGRASAADFREPLVQIQEQAARAAEIIRRIRRFLRKDEADMASCNLNQIVCDVCRIVDHEARQRGFLLVTQLAPGLPSTEVDRIQIEQVVLNLIRNGFDAMEENDPNRRRLHLETRRSESAVELEVRDWGVGLEAGDTEKIFEAFHTTKPDGLGMGLAISRSIVENHGGRLTAVALSAADGGGALFRMTLPLPVPAKTPTSPHRPPHAAHPPTPPPKIAAANNLTPEPFTSVGRDEQT